MLQTSGEKWKKEGVGAFVGRFQVSDLTDGHKSLFESVIERHQKTICVIGLAEIKASKNNPLDFESRRKMIEKLYPEITIVYIKDATDDKAWSKKLDNLISTHIPPASKVVLYGSRDSFIKRYHGRFETKELVQESFTSGTCDRTNNAFAVTNTKDFRAGVIWATQNQYDNCFPTVDIAIVDRTDPKNLRLLLARKPGEVGYRFVGGFVEPKGDPGTIDVLELNAKREVEEETHVLTDDYKYVASLLVDDWRYRYERSKIVTTLFKATYIHGKPEPDDDVEELRWFSVSEDKDVVMDIINNTVREHKPLMKAYLLDELGDKEGFHESINQWLK